MLTNAYKYLFMGLLVVLVAMTAWAAGASYQQGEELSRVTAARDALQVKVDGYKSQVLELETAISTQNAKVKAFAEEAEYRKKRSEALLASARASSAQWKSKLDAVLNSPRPSPDDCTAVQIRLNQYYQTLEDK